MGRHRTHNKQIDETANAEARKLNVLRELLEGRFSFRPELPVTKKSCYGDALWDWRDSSNPRLNAQSPSTLYIDWTWLQTRFNFSDKIIDDLKRYVFLRLAHSPHVFPTSIKNPHPRTLSNEIGAFALFLSHLRDELSVGGCHLINSLSEIEVQDLSDALSTYTGGNLSSIKRTLKYLAGPGLADFLNCGALKWRVEDVDTLDWNIPQGGHYERLPSDMFRLLSDSATADVKHFLRALRIKTQDVSKIGEGPNIYLSAYENFEEIFEGYKEARIAYRREPNGAGEQIYRRFKSKVHGARQVSDLIERAREAAMTILTIYTGARISELCLLTCGCLRREGDHWVILGTLIKRQDLNKQDNKDKWAAIPIMRDAVRVLELVCPVTGSNYLFHGLFKRPGDRAMTSAKLAKKLTAYLRRVDVNRRWENRRIHPHQFRNSLAFELRKAGLGLPFITFQLKHAYYAMEHRINNDTIGYGGIGRDACVMEVRNANLEALRDIYHPDSPVAGGGAAQHKSRRAAYFQGMALHGINPDDVLRQLARSGAPPLTDVGPAHCLGQRTVVVDGVKSDPPCIGGLRCNPVRCPNGIIPRHKLPVWERIAKDNRKRAQDPEFSHARSYLEEAAEEAEAVIRFFRDDYEEN